MCRTRFAAEGRDASGGDVLAKMKGGGLLRDGVGGRIFAPE
jgi:hypothetical protein